MKRGKSGNESALAVQPPLADQPGAAKTDGNADNGGQSRRSDDFDTLQQTGGSWTLTSVGVLVGAVLVIATVVIFAVALGPRRHLARNFFHINNNNHNNGGGGSLNIAANPPPNSISQHRLIVGEFSERSLLMVFFSFFSFHGYIQFALPMPN